MKSGFTLIIEHGQIGICLFVLEKMMKKMEEGEKIPFLHFNNIIIFLHEFADHCHHLKEEICFFPEVIKTKDKKLSILVTDLIDEHKKARELITELKHEFGKYKNGEKDEEKMFRNIIFQYIILLKKHISKENEILFPLSEKVLTEKTDKKIVDGFLKIDKKTNKNSIRIINDLKKKYFV